MRVLGGADAARGLEADVVARRVAIVAERAQHDEAHRQRRVDILLACRGLDEIGARLHGDHARSIDIAEGLEFAGGEDRLHVRLAAGFAHRRHLVVKRRPVAVEDVGAADHDVDFTGALADGVADFGEPQRQRHEAGGKAGRDRSDRNAGALERLHGGGNHRRIDADRADFWRAIREAQRGEQVFAQGPLRLGAKPAHAPRSIVARERRQIDAGKGLNQPRGLKILLHRAARHQRRGASLDGAGVDPHGFEGGRVEPRSRVAGAVMANEFGAGDVHGGRLAAKEGGTIVLSGGGWQMASVVPANRRSASGLSAPFRRPSALCGRPYHSPRGLAAAWPQALDFFLHFPSAAPISAVIERLIASRRKMRGCFESGSRPGPALFYYHGIHAGRDRIVGRDAR